MFIWEGHSRNDEFLSPELKYTNSESESESDFLEHQEIL